MSSELQKPRKTVESADFVKASIGGALVGAGVSILLTWLWQIRNHTIPPIIIKSDSGEIETESEFDIVTNYLRSGESSIDTLAARPFKYSIDTNYAPNYIRVLKFNEDYASLIPVKYTMDFGVSQTMEIWLQRYNRPTNTWVWVDEDEPQIKVTRTASNSLEWEFDRNLSNRQDNDHPRRPVKYQYRNGNGQILRFGLIDVSGWVPIDLKYRGDEFIIAFSVD